MITKRVLQGAKIAKICDSCYQVLLIVKLTVGVKIVPSTVGDESKKFKYSSSSSTAKHRAKKGRAVVI